MTEAAPDESWVQRRQMRALLNPLWPWQDELPRGATMVHTDYCMKTALAVYRSDAVFGGQPTWHAAAAHIGRDMFAQTSSIDELRCRQRGRLKKICRLLLRGVGDSALEEWIFTGNTFQLRRPVLKAERGRIPGKWLDAPPHHRR